MGHTLVEKIKRAIWDIEGWLGELEDEVSEVTEEKDNLSYKYNQANDEVSDLKSELNDRNEEIANQEREIEKLQADLDYKNEEINNLEDQSQNWKR